MNIRDVVHLLRSASRFVFKFQVRFCVRGSTFGFMFERGRNRNKERMNSEPT